MNAGSGAVASVYSGTRASYVALSAISILALALLCSIWTSEVSGSVAVLGLMAIYLASQELLVLFMVFAPASILVDTIRLSGTSHDVHGRGWLVFLQLLAMAAKVAGAVFSWSLYKSVSSGEGSSYPSYAAPPPGPALGSVYQRVEDPFSTAYSPPRQDTQQAQSQLTTSNNTQQQQQQQHQQSGARPAAAVPQPAAPHHDLV